MEGVTLGLRGLGAEVEKKAGDLSLSSSRKPVHKVTVLTSAVGEVTLPFFRLRGECHTPSYLRGDGEEELSRDKKSWEEKVIYNIQNGFGVVLRMGRVLVGPEE